MKKIKSMMILILRKINNLQGSIQFNKFNFNKQWKEVKNQKWFK